jgi:hypothetical protein
MSEQQAWPPAGEDPEGPDAEQVDEAAPGIDEGSDGSADGDAAGTSDPQPYG